MIRLILRLPRPVTLREHCQLAFVKVAVLWGALLTSALAIEYLPLPLTRIV